MAELRKDPYLLVEEETYEPPEDPDSGLSLDQLGMQALNRLPRDKVIDGIRAFNDMRYVYPLVSIVCIANVNPVMTL